MQVIRAAECGLNTIAPMAGYCSTGGRARPLDPWRVGEVDDFGARPRR